MSMRRIKVGDTVQAFLDANIKGEVMQIEALSSAPWLVGGTSAAETFCVLKLENCKVIKYRTSELHHVQ